MSINGIVYENRRRLPSLKVWIFSGTLKQHMVFFLSFWHRNLSRFSVHIAHLFNWKSQSTSCFMMDVLLKRTPFTSPVKDEGTMRWIIVTVLPWRSHICKCCVLLGQMWWMSDWALCWQAQRWSTGSPYRAHRGRRSWCQGSRTIPRGRRGTRHSPAEDLGDNV